MRLDEKYFSDIKGAVYIPARAYNAYQMWNEYSEQETLRDISYAVKLGINAFRIWISFEYWKVNKEKFHKSFDNFIENTSKARIMVMPSLFEDCGRETSKETLEAKDPLLATAVKSPGSEVTSNPEKWDDCYEFVKWFMSIYKDDKRLLAIEVMNEPHINLNNKTENLCFARAMFKYAREHSGNLPLTIGCINLEHNLYFMEYGLDILQYHDNFPKSVEAFEKELFVAKETEMILGKPVWITEWQRVRTSGPGWNKSDIPEEDKLPDLSSLADSIKKYNVGSFLWSLMLKPAYLPAQRLNGTINGIFHEDGAVYSLADAQAVADDTSLDLEEKRTMPEWYKLELDI